MTIAELKRKRKELVGKLRALADNAALTEAEVAEFEELKAEVAKIDAQIERLEFVAGREAELEQVDTVPARPAPDADPAPRAARPERPVIENPGFAALGELIYCARFQPHDSRIRALQEMDTGAGGGFAVPSEFDPMLREVTPQEAIVRPRATVIPPGDAPDADITFPVLDQGSGSNMYGGVTVGWTAEGGTKPESTAALKEATWKPQEVSGHIVVTDKLLRNWAAAGPVLDRLLRGALLSAEDVAFYTGNGIGKPRGWLESAATKLVNRAGANDVVYQDLVDMEAEFYADGGAMPVFVVNPRVIPKLRVMEDTGGTLIWNENAREGGIPTLLGLPVLKNYRSPALGSKGDVAMADFRYYVIKDGVATTVQASEHVHFTANKTVVKAFRTVDGAPWLDGPIAQEDGQTYSPFVALDVP